MCIVLISTAHPDYPFILLSNRDEFLDRPTAHVDWWDPPNQHVLGGRDLQHKERGTWLAITKQGRIAALTNFREEGDDRKRKDKSRGGIVNAYLTSPPEERESSQAFAHRMVHHVGVHDVGGFSLLFGELRAPKNGSQPGLSILSNRSASSDSLTTIARDPGETHGLSNSHFGDKSWPKVVHGERLLNQAIQANVTRAYKQRDAIETPTEREDSNEKFVKSLFAILSIDLLPQRQQGEGWDTYVRQMRNSILIPPVGGPAVVDKPGDLVASASVNGTATSDHGDVQVGEGSYGTQKQAIILVDKNGKVTFVERTLYDESRRPTEGSDRERVVEFEIEGWDS